jgi:threonine aldolase
MGEKIETKNSSDVDKGLVTMMANILDLRSDTITKPTRSMRKAMAEAEVGDDVFGEDPTVRALEDMTAKRLGKEAGLFVTSGTMGNLVCEMSHCGRGDEMILGDQHHIFFYEQGGSAAIGGIHSRTLPNNPDGTIDLKAIAGAIRPDNIHFPRTRLIVLENTHNRCNGSPLSIDYMHQVGNLAHEKGIKLHVDGARLFNAARALNVKARDLVAPADSVTICLSKGLAAPAGSVVCGNSDFIGKARRVRKVLGGGMRQVGVLAAAGIVALTEMVDRLVEDHENAKKLALGLAEIPGIKIDPETIRTNIVYFEITRENLTADILVKRLDRNGVKVLPTGERRIRAVTHYHIRPSDIEKVIARIRILFYGKRFCVKYGT